MPFIPDGCVGLWFPGRGTPGQRRGTVLDQSGQNNHGTFYGVPALYFDGVNDKAAVTTPWDTLGTKRYAWIACWFNVTDALANREIFQETWNASANSKLFAYIEITTAKLVIAARTGASTDTSRSSTSSNAVPLGSWNSLLIALDVGTSPNPTAYAWLNGAAFTMGAFSGAVAQTTWVANVPSYQGWGLTSDNAYDYLGYMQWLGYGGMDALPTVVDAQRFYDDPEAWLRQSGLPAYWYCKEDANGTVDNAEGTAGRDLTMTGATWSSLITLAHGGDARNASGTANSGDSFNAGYRFFDGTDDCLQIADAASLRFGNNPYQIHVWASIPVGAGLMKGIIGKGSTAAGEWYLRLRSAPNDGKLNFYAVDTGGVNVINILGGSDLTDGVLHLLSVLRNGDDVYLYVDGVQIATDSVAINLTEATKPVQIMAADGGNNHKGNVYKVFIGTANKTIAQANADMQALLQQGPYT